MKARRNVYLIIGSVLIILNLLLDITSLSEYKSQDSSYSIGYFIGSHFFMITGLVLYRMAYKINRRLKSNNPDSLEEDIKKIGSK